MKRRRIVALAVAQLVALVALTGCTDDCAGKRTHSVTIIVPIKAGMVTVFAPVTEQAC